MPKAEIDQCLQSSRRALQHKKAPVKRVKRVKHEMLSKGLKLLEGSESWRLHHIAGFSSLYESLRLENIIELLIQHSMQRCPIAACNLQLLPLQPLQPLTPPWYTQFSLLISPCTAQIAHGFCLKIQYTKALPQKIPFLGARAKLCYP